MTPIASPSEFSNGIPTHACAFHLGNTGSAGKRFCACDGQMHGLPRAVCAEALPASSYSKLAGTPVYECRQRFHPFELAAQELSDVNAVRLQSICEMLRYGAEELRAHGSRYPARDLQNQPVRRAVVGANELACFWA